MEFKASAEVVNKDSELAKGERNDCVVIAIAAATGKTYEEAHAYCKETLKRPDLKGTHVLRNIETPSGFDMLGIEAKVLDTKAHSKHYKRSDVWRANSISTFLESHQTGAYIVLVRKHAFAVVDGTVIDNPNLLHKTARKVMNVIKVG